MITIILGRAAQLLIALIMMRVATTLLTPEEMGKVSLVMTTTAFFAMFLVNPVGMFINRRIHAWQKNGNGTIHLIRYAIYLILIALFAALVLVAIDSVRWFNFGLSVNSLLILVCGSLIFNTINQTAIPSLNLLGESRKFLLMSLLTIIASFICATLFVTWGHPTAHNWLLGILLGQALLGVVGIKFLFNLIKSADKNVIAIAVRKQHLNKLWSFAWPVAIAAGLAWLQGQGYRYLMEEQLGLTQLGLFVAGYGISAGMIAGFESVLTTYFQPRLYRDVSIEKNHDKNVQAWQWYAAAVMPSLILTIVFIIILAPELTAVFLGEDFRSAADFLIWGAIAEAARILIGVYALIAHIFMRTRWLVIPNLIGALLSMILCAVLIPILGSVGVGVGLATAGVISIFSSHLLLAKRVGGGPPTKPMVSALIAGILLWLLTLLLREIIAVTGWMKIASVLVPVGLSYLAFQYFHLRIYLKK